MTSRAGIGALAVGAALLMVALGVAAGPLAFFSISCNGCGSVNANVNIPSSSTCVTGTACTISGTYTLNGIGVTGATMQYTLNGVSGVSNGASAGAFSIQIPSQPAGTIQTLQITIPGTTVTVSDRIAWLAVPTATFTVMVNYQNQPVPNVQVTISLVGGGSVAIGQTNSAGTSNFVLPVASYEAAAQVPCAESGAPISAVGYFPTAGQISQTGGASEEVVITLPTVCQTQTTTTTGTSTGTTVVTSTVTTQVTTVVSGTTTVSPSTSTMTTTVTSVSTTGNGQSGSISTNTIIATVLGIVGTIFLGIGGVEVWRTR